MLNSIIAQKLILLPTTTYWLAYSGGLDSHVLLHLCAEALKNTSKQLKAIHVNHSLSPNALAWQKHCEKVCENLAIPLHCVQVNAAPQSGKSPEAVARELRYQVFRDLLQPGECLLTAHHQNDQAETVLLQLLRGAGPSGLAAMPELSTFAAGHLLRPLLSFSRQELLQYAEQQYLVWIEDESNFDTTYDRNFIRHQLMPLLQQRWPAVTTTLARVATNCAEAMHLLQILAAQDGGVIIQLASSTSPPLALQRLRELDAMDATHSRSRNVIRLWLKQQNFSIPSRIRLQQLHDDFIHAKPDANPYMRWDRVEIRRYHDALYAMSPLSLLPRDSEFIWDMHDTFILPQNLGQLRATKLLGQGFILPNAASKVTVRFRRGGERCQPMGRRGSHPLKKLLQEWEVPSWQRDRIPLLYWQEQLVAVLGFCVCEPFASHAEQVGWVTTHFASDL